MTNEVKTEVESETTEQAYRRGYSDGYVAALNAIYAKREIPEKHWNFWHNILEGWRRRAEENNVFELPPEQ